MYDCGAVTPAVVESDHRAAPPVGCRGNHDLLRRTTDKVVGVAVCEHDQVSASTLLPGDVVSGTDELCGRSGIGRPQQVRFLPRHTREYPLCEPQLQLPLPAR
jgi:hypothetical protein